VAGAAAVVVVAVAVGLQLAGLAGRDARPGATGAPLASATPGATAVTDAPSASPEQPAATGEPASPEAQAVSRIAFTANRDDADSSDIYTMNPDGTDIRRLTSDPTVHETNPQWSPNGELVAYLATTSDGSFRGGIFLMNADGSDPVQVTDEFPYGPPAWSPDGSMLAIGSDGSAGAGISIYRVADGSLTQLTTDGGGGPMWSPDGSTIAYSVNSADPNAVPPNAEVYTVDVSSGEVTNVTDDPAGDDLVAWTDDGARIIFSSDRGTDGSKGSARLWIIDAGGGTAEEYGDLDPRLVWTSPDGEWRAYGADDGLHLSRSDGTDDRLVHVSVPADRGPSWSPDSRAFVFSASEAEQPRDVFLMSVDAEAPVRLTDEPSDDSGPRWQPQR